MVIISSEIIGAIFPVPHDLLNRILDQGKDVFVKKPTLFKELKPGSKILFYASHEVKAILGEGTIEDLEFLSPKEAVGKYGNRLFLSKEELDG